MPGFMRNIYDQFSPAKAKAKTRSIGAAAPEPEPVPLDKMQRGTKRKGVYDLDDAEVESVAATPASRTRSRRSSATPSSAKSRPSASKTKRFSVAKRLSAVGGVAPASPLNAVASSNDQAEEPLAARAPMADMGGAELLERQPEPEAEPEEKKASVNEPAEAEIAHEKPSPKIAQDKVPAPEPAKEQPTEQRAEVLLGKKMEEDDIHEIKALVGHKVSEDAPGRIIIQVKWVDDSEITWEPEENIQDGASEMLFDYWKKQGGREGALFQKGSKPLLGEQYWVYKILNHERVRSAFRFHVQWVGYPADATNTSWETEAKLKKCAQELLDEYWAMKGGRDQFLAKRGRAKKARTE